MAGWVCTACTAVYSVGAPRCPQCGATEHVEEGHEDMAKITRHGGLSNAAAEQPEEESSLTPEAAGTTSPASSEKPKTSPKTNEPAPQSPAPATGSRSGKGRKGSSTARPTATAGPKTDGTDPSA